MSKLYTSASLSSLKFFKSRVRRYSASLRGRNINFKKKSDWLGLSFLGGLLVENIESLTRDLYIVESNIRRYADLKRDIKHTCDVNFTLNVDGKLKDLQTPCILVREFIPVLEKYYDTEISKLKVKKVELLKKISVEVLKEEENNGETS